MGYLTVLKTGPCGTGNSMLCEGSARREKTAFRHSLWPRRARRNSRSASV
jgi:hypothetical protein